MPYCENCGSQVNPNAKFCGNCGAARVQTQETTIKAPVKIQVEQPKRERLSYYSPPSPTSSISVSPAPPTPVPPTVQAATPTQPSVFVPLPQAGSETTYGVILFKKMKSLGRYDSYTGVLTSQRIIFAQLTSEMIQIAVAQSRNQAKAEGKGFFGQWSDQLKAAWGYSQKYLAMPPQMILAETPGNFELYNAAINEIKMKIKGGDEGQMGYFEVGIHSSAGKFDFVMDENSQFTGLLKQVYGARVKMPFGYFNKSINIKF